VSAQFNHKQARTQTNDYSGSYSQRAGAGNYSRYTNAEFRSGSYSQRAHAGSYSRHKCITSIRELLPESWCRELLPAHKAQIQSGSYSQRARAGSYSRRSTVELQSGSYSQRAGAGSYSRHTNAEFRSGSYSQRAGAGSYSRRKCIISIRELLPESWCRELLPALPRKRTKK